MGLSGICTCIFFSLLYNIYLFLISTSLSPTENKDKRSAPLSSLHVNHALALSFSSFTV